MFQSLLKRPFKTQFSRSVTDYSETKGQFKLQIQYVKSPKDIKKDLVEDSIQKYGYAFFRGADITDCQKLSDLRTVVFKGEIFDYFRHGGIYTATRKDNNKIPGVYEFVNVSTPFWDMPAHNDLSYRPAMAHRTCIAQFRPADQGGCTPLYDTRIIWLELIDKFYKLMCDCYKYGLTYTKNLPDANNKEKARVWMETADIPTWQSNFPGMTQNQITEELSKVGETVVWEADGTCKISWSLPAFRQHPDTGENFFTNQYLGFEARNFWQWPGRPFGDLEYIDCPTHVRLGNGRDFTDEEYTGILDIHHKYAIRGKWERGDLVVMDNIRMTHSRDPYVGRRELAIMWGDEVPLKK